jgi:hypothetical protein
MRERRFPLLMRAISRWLRPLDHPSPQERRHAPVP